jgi:hypothetical protein
MNLIIQFFFGPEGGPAAIVLIRLAVGLIFLILPCSARSSF